MEKRVCRGIRRYTIRAYSDIDSLLDKGWHCQGLNESGDYCDLVEFYLYQKRSLQEFFPSSPSSYSCDRDQGYGLVFTLILFVEMALPQILEEIKKFSLD